MVDRLMPPELVTLAPRATTNALTQVQTELLPDGASCYVSANGDVSSGRGLYRLDRERSGPGNGGTLIEPSSGPGLWVFDPSSVGLPRLVTQQAGPANPVVVNSGAESTLLQFDVSVLTQPIGRRFIPQLESVVTGTVVDDNAQLLVYVGDAPIADAPVFTLISIYEQEIAVAGVNVSIYGFFSLPFLGVPLPSVIQSMRLTVRRSQGSGTLTWADNLTIFELRETNDV